MALPSTSTGIYSAGSGGLLTKPRSDWCGRSIARRNGTILVVLLFIFENVWMNLSNVYDLHI